MARRLGGGARERLKRAARKVLPGLAGAGVSTITSPVGGAATTAALEGAIDAVGHDFFTAQLSAAQERRSRACFEEARRRIWERRAAGDSPSEWVVTPTEGPLRSLEVLEAGLWSAREQFEERKIKHLAALLEYVFYSTSGPSDAHHFLEAGAQLSYRQIVLLSLFGTDQERSRLPDKAWGASVTWTDMGLFMEADDLADRHMLADDKFRLIGNYAEINPRRTQVSIEGSLLYQAMALDEVERADRDAVIKQLELVHTIVLGDRPPSTM